MWWNISKGTWPLQFAWGIRSLFQNNEENDVFTKTKEPFSLNVKLKKKKGGFVSVNNENGTDIF